MMNRHLGQQDAAWSGMWLAVALLAVALAAPSAAFAASPSTPVRHEESSDRWTGAAAADGGGGPCGSPVKRSHDRQSAVHRARRRRPRARGGRSARRRLRPATAVRPGQAVVLLGPEAEGQRLRHARGGSGVQHEDGTSTEINRATRRTHGRSSRVVLRALEAQRLLDLIALKVMPAVAAGLIAYLHLGDVGYARPGAPRCCRPAAGRALRRCRSA